MKRLFTHPVRIAIAFLAVLFVGYDRHSSRDALMVSLVDAAPADARAIEPRLSGGFAWAPLRPASRGVSHNAVQASVIASTLADAMRESSPSARHTAGVAQLLGGESRAALTGLTHAAEASNDPRAWNDLAVAFHENAIQYQAPELLADALTACDRALSIDPNLAEALFNRALFIEKLGLRDDAREAWARYLTIDSGEWTIEARAHYARLAPVTPFLQQLGRIAIPELVRRDPQEARTRGEMNILGRWGAAVLRGDVGEAQRQLSIAREIAANVERINGDVMLVRAVGAIDAAEGPIRSTLAAAHAGYGAGLSAFQNNEPVAAEPQLARAAEGFEQGGSAMSLLARFFAANAAFEQGRHDEGERAVEALLATAPAGLDAYRGQLLAQLGVCHAARAEWGESMRFLEQSTTLFEQLGEIRNAAFGHRVLAVIYDRAGDSRNAWKHRMIALRGAGDTSGLALEKAVSSIAGEAILHRNWQTASSFLNLEIGIARRISDHVQLADSLLLRAGVRTRLHDVAGARDDLSAAAAESALITDPAYRAYGHGAQAMVRAMLATSSSESIALLNEAVEFEIAKGDRVHLPGLFLQRGRARRNGGDPKGAAADYQSGIAEAEAHRESLPRGDARWRAFYSTEELFEEAIDLALQRGETVEAFSVAERARARSLLDVYGRSPAVDVRRLPSGTTVVEYAALPSRLVIFVADSNGVSAVSTECDRDALTAEVAALADALADNRTVAAKRAAAALYRRLVTPIEGRLHGADTLAFVPDGVTSRTPFSALIDERGAYLLERYAVLNAPSAAVFEAALERRRSRPHPPRSALVVASPAQDADQQYLAAVDDEAARVARAYRSSVVLQEKEADLATLAEHAGHTDVLHFAGHAVGDESGLTPAAIVLRDGNRVRHVEAAEIARIPLTRISVVVLAGCSTARGERSGTEGVLSVAHGFLAAGAPSVIATLWPIDDQAAAIFFPRIHRRLAEGLSPAEALREVQLESIRHNDVPASLWAALQDIGS